MFPQRIDTRANVPSKQSLENLGRFYNLDLSHFHKLETVKQAPLAPPPQDYFTFDLRYLSPQHFFLPAVSRIGENAFNQKEFLSGLKDTLSNLTRVADRTFPPVTSGLVLESFFSMRPSNKIDVRLESHIDSDDLENIQSIFGNKLHDIKGTLCIGGHGIHQKLWETVRSCEGLKREPKFGFYGFVNFEPGQVLPFTRGIIMDNKDQIVPDFELSYKGKKVNIRYGNLAHMLSKSRRVTKLQNKGYQCIEDYLTALLDKRRFVSGEIQVKKEFLETRLAVNFLSVSDSQDVHTLVFAKTVDQNERTMKMIYGLEENPYSIITAFPKEKSVVAREASS